MKRPMPLLMMSVLPMVLGACGNLNEAPLPLSSPTYDRALVYLQTQSHSPDAAVRANCIEALQPSRDPRAVEMVEQGLHDNEWVVRFAAVMASAELKGVQAANVRPTINTMVTQDPSGSVRAGCVYALRQLGDTTHMNDLPRLLDSTDPATRANTAFVLGLMGDRTAITLLEHYRDVPDIRVRFEVTSAMARLGDELSQQVIAGWAVNKFAEDQWTAMSVCGDLPPAVGRSPLLLGLENAPVKLPPDMSDTDKAVVKRLTARRQLVAARSLAKMHDYSGSKIAIAYAADEDPALRALAALALGDMLDSRQAPALDRMLSDPDDGVKRAAAAAVIAIYARAQAGKS